MLNQGNISPPKLDNDSWEITHGAFLDELHEEDSVFPSLSVLAFFSLGFGLVGGGIKPILNLHIFTTGCGLIFVGIVLFQRLYRENYYIRNWRRFWYMWVAPMIPTIIITSTYFYI